jgi:hypothetical protein
VRRAALTVAAGALLLGGCGFGSLTSGSGTVVESTPELEAFDAVTIASAFEVTLRPGDEAALVLRTDDNLVDRIDVGVEAGTLSLGLDGAVRDATLQADLTVPAAALTSITLSGAATLTGTEPLESPTLSVSLDGASRAFLVLATDELEVSAEGASVVNASGSAASLSASAADASSLALEQLAAVSAVVEADGASSVRVSVSGDLDVRAAGASTVRYAGDPDVVGREVSGASSVQAE